jgi:hypothetical protein
VLEGNHGLVVFYAKKEACVPVKMGCKPVGNFLWRKWFRSLMKATLSAPEATEIS